MARKAVISQYQKVKVRVSYRILVWVGKNCESVGWGEGEGGRGWLYTLDMNISLLMHISIVGPNLWISKLKIVITLHCNFSCITSHYVHATWSNLLGGGRAAWGYILPPPHPVWNPADYKRGKGSKLSRYWAHSTTTVRGADMKLNPKMSLRGLQGLTLERKS